MRGSKWAAAALCALAFAGCKLGADAGSDGAPTKESTDKEGVTPKGYETSSIKAIPDNCSSPWAILATAPASVGANYPWNISRQALLANQQFKVVSGPPTAPGQVSLSTHSYNDSAFALVAQCKDGGTCNQVAAMYKAIVRSSSPQVYCGKIQGAVSASPVGSPFSWSPDPKGNLPVEGDAIALCARLSACMIATDRSTPGDPFVECQKAPHHFKTKCATRYPCAEVLACTGK
ncbi:MAG: hypothetical protein IT372_18995 [Polyangiaceae bacterium]|nr:hypothetical protein [Polyangiaceae bacterium]